MNILIFTFLILSSAKVFAVGEQSFVDLSQFKKGNYWVWLYSEFNPRTNIWEPYLEERYTVIWLSGKKMTIEMSSSGVGSGGLAPAHHKFTMDFKNCEMSGARPAFRYWTVQFYTRNYISGDPAADPMAWTLVSNAHPNLVFTEKFNCSKIPASTAIDYQDILFWGEPQKIFQKHAPPTAETSWYFLSHPKLKGVAHQKYFKPDDMYKNELIEYGEPQL